MLNFGHLRQTSPRSPGRAQTSHPPCFIRAGKAFGPPQRAAKRFAAVNTRTFFFCFPGHSPPIQRLCAVPAVPGDPPGTPAGGTALKSEAPYVKQSLFDFTITSAKIQIPIQGRPHSGAARSPILAGVVFQADPAPSAAAQGPRKARAGQRFMTFWS